MSGNQEISPKELSQIRSLDDFDLTMLISEIHDHGWPMARQTLDMVWTGFAVKRDLLAKSRD